MHVGIPMHAVYVEVHAGPLECLEEAIVPSGDVNDDLKMRRAVTDSLRHPVEKGDHHLQALRIVVRVVGAGPVAGIGESGYGIHEQVVPERAILCLVARLDVTKTGSVAGGKPASHEVSRTMVGKRRGSIVWPAGEHGQ